MHAPCVRLALNPPSDETDLCGPIVLPPIRCRCRDKIVGITCSTHYVVVWREDSHSRSHHRTNMLCYVCTVVISITVTQMGARGRKEKTCRAERGVTRSVRLNLRPLHQNVRGLMHFSSKLRYFPSAKSVSGPSFRESLCRPVINERPTAGARMRQS